MATREPPLIIIEPENDPNAVIQWCNLTSESSSSKRTMSRDLSLQAKKHLRFLGWTFFYVDKQGRWELRYQSPTGKNYISLRRACQGCIEEEKRCNNVNGTFVKQNNVDQNHPSSSSETRKCKKNKRQRNDYSSWSSSSSSSSSHDDGRGKVLSNIRMVHEGTSGSSKQVHRNLISRLIDNSIVGLNTLVFCRGARNVVKKGKIIRGGIVCDCCGVVFSPTRFEAHAGCSKHRPASTIFLADGRSLMDCHREALCSQKNEKEEESDQLREYQNDNICFVCRYGGDLILCDRCPSSFHLSCLGLNGVPDGDWFCPACCCKTCKRLRSSEDCADDVGVNRLLVCHQCKRRCHIGCITEIGEKIYLDHHENWFCSGACENIFFSLPKLVGKPIHVGEGMTWTLLKSVKTDSCGYEVEGWSQNERKLSVALGILHECFDPVIDAFSGTDMMAGIVFSKSSQVNCLNFGGFYTVVLEMDEEVVSVATIRIFGKRVAEIPFVATGVQFRRLGLCRILMNEIEKQLTFLGVEEIVLPSSETVIDTWTNSFGFTRMSLSDKYQFLGYAFLEFESTTMCRKPLVKQIVT